jgi:chromosome segregation ATPase
VVERVLRRVQRSEAKRTLRLFVLSALTQRARRREQSAADDRAAALTEVEILKRTAAAQSGALGEANRIEASLKGDLHRLEEDLERVEANRSELSQVSSARLMRCTVLTHFLIFASGKLKALKRDLKETVAQLERAVSAADEAKRSESLALRQISDLSLRCAIFRRVMARRTAAHQGDAARMAAALGAAREMAASKGRELAEAKRSEATLAEELRVLRDELTSKRSEAKEPEGDVEGDEEDDFEGFPTPQGRDSSAFGRDAGAVKGDVETKRSEWVGGVEIWSARANAAEEAGAILRGEVLGLREEVRVCLLKVKQGEADVERARDEAKRIEAASLSRDEESRGREAAAAQMLAEAKRIEAEFEARGKALEVASMEAKRSEEKLAALSASLAEREEALRGVGAKRSEAKRRSKPDAVVEGDESDEEPPPFKAPDERSDAILRLWKDALGFVEQALVCGLRLTPQEAKGNPTPEALARATKEAAMANGAGGGGYEGVARRVA